MRKHAFDPVSFVFGLGFLALAAAIALPREPWDVFFSGVSFGWIWPAVVIGAGLALLAPTVKGVRSEPRDEPDDE